MGFYFCRWHVNESCEYVCINKVHCKESKQSHSSSSDATVFVKQSTHLEIIFRTRWLIHKFI